MTMIHVIGDILDRPTLEALHEAAIGLTFEDGKVSAGRYAATTKTNLQARPGPDLDAILKTAEAKILQHALFRSIARPKGFARLLLSRYEPGMGYGLHVDDAVMNGQRTDLSFTLPLVGTETYDGGALIFDEPLEERALRAEAGDMVLYPTGVLHRVEPVTRGMRLAIVGWVTSHVRDPMARDVLHDLDVAAQEMFESQGNSDGFNRLQKAKTNLYRMWADG